MNCLKIGLPGKLILSKRKGIRESIFREDLFLYNCLQAVTEESFVVDLVNVLIRTLIASSGTSDTDPCGYSIQGGNSIIESPVSPLLYHLITSPPGG